MRRSVELAGGVALSDSYADVGGVRLHYVEAGEGPLVVLLHGFPEFWYSWRHQIPALVAAGYRVVAPDMRGYNLSDKPRVDHHLTGPHGLQCVGVTLVQRGEVLPDRIGLACGAGLQARQLHGAGEFRKPRHLDHLLPLLSGHVLRLPSIVPRQRNSSRALPHRMPGTGGCGAAGIRPPETGSTPVARPRARPAPI